MLRPALALALPLWTILAWLLLRTGGRRLAFGGAVALALGLAAWAASRVGTSNPVSRTGRWDPLLMCVMATVLLLVPALATVWGLALGSARWSGPTLVLGAGLLAGLIAVPVALMLAIAVEVLWPH